MKKNVRPQSGFTLAELIIVIAMIGVLAGLVLNVFTDSRKRADAAVVSNTFRQIERSLMLKAISDGVSSWWHENYFEACAGTAPYSPNPEISSMIENCGLDQFLQSIPENGVFDRIVYDADGAQFPSCDSSPNRGVNIRIQQEVPEDVFAIYDEIFDDSDGPTCGDLRQDGSLNVHYLLNSTLEEN